MAHFTSLIMVQPAQALLLGVVEGLTEFLPVSSTGHLILAGWFLHLQGEAVKTFDVVIQAGALVAVIGLYRARLVLMWRSLWSQEPAGRRLLRNLAISFLPAAVVGLLLHHAIKTWLFGLWPVVSALAFGGFFMVGVAYWLRRRRSSLTKALEAITLADALLIGAAQCASLWPGTSRAMVTIVAGLLLGLSASAAAEYSFLLALPTLGAATCFDALSSWHVLRQGVSVVALACGFVTAALVAALAIRGFLHYLTRAGLAPFGWYRIGVAALVWWSAPHA